MTPTLAEPASVSSTPAALDRTLLALLAATLVTFGLGETGLAARMGWAVPAVMLLAWAKGALVAWRFMELRQAPNLWRALVLGWLTVVIAALLGLWALGRGA